jgi:hypothetical protein
MEQKTSISNIQVPGNNADWECLLNNFLRPHMVCVSVKEIAETQFDEIAVSVIA